MRVEERVEQNLVLVEKFMTSKRMPAAPKEEIRSRGLVGLFRAAQTYDPSRRAAFSTWAFHWIRKCVWEDRVQTPVCAIARSTLRKLTRQHQETRLFDYIDIHELDSDKLDNTGHRNHNSSQDCYPWEGAGDCTARGVERRDLAEWVRSHLRRLPLRERYVIERTMGGLISREIAEEMGVRKTTVESHRTHARAKLREAMREEWERAA